jgi:glutaredoxin-related protein
MARPILDPSRLHPDIVQVVANHHSGILSEVQDAVAAHAVLVVGMAGNPFCSKARKLLKQAGIEHKYLEYGSYLSQWRRRNALKMWTGWPTMPMVFVKGQLIGGATDLQRLIRNGDLQRLLA